MIKNVRWVLEDDVLIAYSNDAEEERILFSDINQYWEYATEEDFEGGRIYTHDNLIIFLMLTASGQGGIIVSCNAETKQVEHVSNGDYCVAVDKCGDYVYTACFVGNYNKQSCLQIYRSAYGTIKTSEEPELVIECGDCSDIGDYTGHFDDVDLFVEENVISIRLGDRRIFLK